MYTKKDFDSTEFEEKFHYDGQLGVILSSISTEFRLWAPTAESVRIFLYEKGNDSPCVEMHSLSRMERGVWFWQAGKNLEGMYYDYEVTVDGTTRRTPDPMAIAAGVNGTRSMVLDLRHTDPEGWAEDHAPALHPENVIYEIHVKDFSYDPSCGIEEKKRGKFAALCVTDSTLNNDGIHPTCINYLKKLGVTHVQLMPVYDYGSVDETGPEDQFNFGYDPWNYNLPEGSYSTDPFHGEVRIREMKEAIASLHRNGFRVIMDVVYNHTYRLDSVLFRTVPWYYYRQKEDDSASNGSACSNDIASERSMCARYIIDSVLYWTEEYHIDGFRFDLMGLLDVDIMNRIRGLLDERYGKGEKIIFGEPWRAQDTSTKTGTILADKKAFYLLDECIGAFCDATRDAVKGNLMENDSAGIVNGGKLEAQTLANCITGWVDTEDEFNTQSSAQTISYISSHDDWTLWDRLVFSMDPNKRFDMPQPKLLRANRMAAAIYFCCQGHLFMLSGEEFARTKYGVRDSVRSPMKINSLHWERAWQQYNLAKYYGGLIQLRQQLPGLCDKRPEAKNRLLFCRNEADNYVLAEIDNREEEKLSNVSNHEEQYSTGISDGGSFRNRWDKLLLAVNASEEIHNVNLPNGTWQILVNDTDSLLWMKDWNVTGQTKITPMSVLLLGALGPDLSGKIADRAGLDQVKTV